MTDDRLRRRLEALNRGPLGDEAISPLAPRRGGSQFRAPQAPSRERTVTVPTPRWTTPVPPLTGVLNRGAVIKNSLGEHLGIRIPLEVVWAQGPRLVLGRHRLLRNSIGQRHDGTHSSSLARPPDLSEFVAAFPRSTLFMDLETCGLAGSALFLIGLLRWCDDRPHIELLLARTYAEESAVLATFWDICAAHSVLVTFNGKSFDWPMIVDRSTRYRLAARRIEHPACHVDLLHHARRQWRNQLPSPTKRPSR